MKLPQTIERLHIVEPALAAAVHSFGDDVRIGLSRSPKSIPSKYFYDEVGSRLFDAITALPAYYLTAAETEILREWGWEIVRVLDGPLEFVELGSGSAVKTRLLIEEALRVQRTLRYSPIDISRDALTSASVALVKAHPELTVRAYVGDYFALLGSNALRLERRALAMLMGSNIGNYSPVQAGALLALLGRALRPGDGLLLGTDCKKDPATLERAYDDPTGVTAAFNRNLLARINRELSADFNERSFEHVARYDVERGCVDSYLRCDSPQTVRIEALDVTVPFSQGEMIHTESSYKFDDGDIERLASSGGFRIVKGWSDSRKRFRVSLLVLGSP
jgi:L-histidine N-alpha-methyltransferase